MSIRPGQTALFVGILALLAVFIAYPLARVLVVGAYETQTPLIGEPR